MKKKTAVQKAKMICAVYGDGAKAESTAFKWFDRFRSVNIELEAREVSGKSIVDSRTW